MKLAELSDTHRAFYAPRFAISIRQSDLLGDLHVAVGQVEIDLELGAASRFTFTIPEAYSHKHHKFLTGDGDELLPLIKFGTEVGISIGYVDGQNKNKFLIQGVITEISTDFPDGGSPELSVVGYDNGFPLTIGQNSRTWSQSTDSDVAQSIASANNLGSVIDATKEKHPQIEQNQESDWAFLKKLADRNSYEVYIDAEKKLHFGLPKVDSEPVVELSYGEGLLTFKPEANLAGQISKVEVYGWDRTAKKAIVGVATAGEELGLIGKSPGEFLRNLVRDPQKQPTLRLRQPVFTQAEADQRAKAALNENSKKFVTGEGESIGLPEILPDTRVTLTNLGSPFSMTYYVRKAVHKIDSGGYRTRFTLEVPGAKEKEKAK